MMAPPLFRYLEPSPSCEIVLDGDALSVPIGYPLAQVLLAAGHLAWGKAPITGEPAGPLCLIGTCFQCLARVDGRDGQRLCRTAAHAGMVIETGLGRDA